jgi:hypothetical protein
MPRRVTQSRLQKLLPVDSNEIPMPWNRASKLAVVSSNKERKSYGRAFNVGAKISARCVGRRLQEFTAARSNGDFLTRLCALETPGKTRL